MLAGKAPFDTRRRDLPVGLSWSGHPRVAPEPIRRRNGGVEAGASKSGDWVRPAVEDGGRTLLSRLNRPIPWLHPIADYPIAAVQDWVHRTAACGRAGTEGCEYGHSSPRRLALRSTRSGRWAIGKAGRSMLVFRTKAHKTASSELPEGLTIGRNGKSRCRLRCGDPQKRAEFRRGERYAARRLRSSRTPLDRPKRVMSRRSLHHSYDTQGSGNLVEPKSSRRKK